MKDDMKEPYICLRGSIWHYRRRVPLRLAEIIGKAEWKTSLKTPDRKKAARMAHMLTLQYDAEIELAEQKLARKHPGEALHLTDEQVTNLSLLHFRDLAKEVEAWMMRDQGRDFSSYAMKSTALSASLKAKSKWQAGVNLALNELVKRGFVDPDQLEKDEHGEPVVPEVFMQDPQFQRLAMLMVRAKGEVSNAMFLQASQGVTGQVTDQHFAQQPHSVTKPVTIDDLITAHETGPSRSGRTAKADVHFKIPYRLLREELGANKPLSEITRDDIKKLIPLLLEFPPRGTSRFISYQPKTLRDIVRIGKSKGIEPIGPKSVNRHLANLSSLFRFAVREEMMRSNPAENLAVDAKHQRTKERKAFSGKQLQAIFGKDYAGLRKTNPGRFWVPLLSLFSGMRLNEAASLEVGDIMLEPLPCIKVQAEGVNDKSLKTRAAERIFPIHPELIKLGFLEHVKEVKAAGGDHLFPDLKRSKADGKFTGSPALSHHTGQLQTPSPPANAMQAAFPHGHCGENLLF